MTNSTTLTFPGPTAATEKLFSALDYRLPVRGRGRPRRLWLLRRRRWLSGSQALMLRQQVVDEPVFSLPLKYPVGTVIVPKLLRTPPDRLENRGIQATPSRKLRSIPSFDDIASSMH